MSKPLFVTHDNIVHSSIRKLCSLTAITLLLSGCTNYSLNVNENVVYSPPALFSDFKVTDPYLKNCLQQNIIEQQITTAEGLTTLSCSNANIQDLAGIEVFTQLQKIDFSNNAISDISAISKLKQVSLLLLNSNEITSVNALKDLEKLNRLELKDNPTLSCRLSWPHRPAKLLLPKRCG